MKELCKLLQVPADWMPEVNDGWAATEDMLIYLAKHILDNKPQSILECGSGLTTLVMARALELKWRDYVGEKPFMHSMEHDEKYFNRTKAWLKERNLDKTAYLNLFEIGGTPPFYNFNFRMPTIDMMVVDGPPSALHPMARYGAKQLFRHLSGNAHVFMDDLDRPGEQMIRDVWFNEFHDQFRFEGLDIGHGCLHMYRHRGGKKRILVSVPSLGWMHRDVHYMLANLLQEKRFDVDVTLPMRKPVEAGYCEAAKRFWEGDYDFLLSVDSDNPPQNNPLDLVYLDKDIIGYPTPIWRPSRDTQPFTWNAMKYLPDEDIYVEWPTPHGLQQVDAVGTGCILINRRVFENKRMRVRPFMRSFNRDGKVTRGTDVNFCHKARKNGFEVWAHFDYKCFHYKEVELGEALMKISNMGNIAREKRKEKEGAGQCPEPALD